MMDTQHQWSEALASNNIGAIIRWLRKLTAEGEADVEEIPLTFSSWVQRTSEFAKKELLTLCFSRCQGLWMFLDRSSFTRVHMLLQRLRNLLTLAQWSRRQLSSAHLWHGMGVPCVVCGDTSGSSDVRRGCWNREHRALKQHIWLGRLVQWWGIMGLLPKQPEAHEVKRISQMWKEMGHGRWKACLETHGCEEGVAGRFGSLIQGMVTQLDRQHGCFSASEDCTDPCYPPPNLQSLLKLVLVPHIDNMSVQALLMYFVLDMANFLQCKDDLLQSFCNAFTIPSSFSQQIRAFWMLDHGHIKASMELLLSPRAAVPWLSWQHGCIIHCLLTRKQPQLALRYLHWTRPAIENAEDAKLFADVLLQNNCISEAWKLLKRGHTESNNTVMYFLKACDRVGLCAEALKYIPAGYHGEGENVNGIETTGSLFRNDKSAVRPTRPLSADLYRAQKVSTVSPEELVRLVRNAVMEMRKPHPKMSEVVWPEHTGRKWHSREMFLSTQALRHLAPSPSPMDLMVETEPTAHAEEPQVEQPVQNQQPESPEQTSSSGDLNTESVSSFTSASSLPLLRRQRCHIYESTLTLQRISSLLNDQENQNRGDEEEDSRNPSPFHALPDCPELVLTLDGATDPIFLGNLDKDALAGLVLSAEDGEDVETDVFPSKDFLSIDAFPGPSIDETFFLNKSTENNQSVPDLCEPEFESHSFLLPEDEKLAWCKEVSKETKKTDQEGHSDCIRYEIFDVGEAATFDCLLQEELLRKTYENHQQEDTPGCSGQGFSCATSETTQDPQQDLLPSEDPAARSSRSPAGTSQRDVSLFPPVCSSVCPTQFQQISGSFLTSSTTYNIKTTSAPSDTTGERDEPCFQRTSAGWLDHCETGSWWKQDLDTCGAASGLLSATDAGTANTSDDKKSLLVPSPPPSSSLVNFMDFTARQKGDSRDGKQANKEEPAGWSSFGRGSQGAIRSGRTRSRKGKRVKKA